MNVDYKISQVEDDGSSAHIRPDDLFCGKRIVYLGGDINYQEEMFLCKNVIDERVLRFPSFSKFLENDAEIILTHEFIHLLLWELNKNLDVVRSLDNIDLYDEISGYTLL